MRKILILANRDTTLLYYRKELINKLIQNGNTVIVSFPKDGNFQYFKDIGCEFVNIKMERRGMNPIKDFKILINYIKLIKEKKPDVVLTYTIKPNIYGGLASRFTKISHIPNFTGLGSMFQKKGILAKLIIFLYKKALKNSTKVFVQNEDNKRILIKHRIINEKQCRLIPGSGVNLEKFCKEEYPTERRIKFLFIGRIMKEKGINEYIEAAINIKQRYKNTEFHIIGDLEEKIYEKSIRQLHEKQIIIYHGVVNDSKPYIKQIHCTILPSYHEGKSNVLLESAATGRAVITTNIPGCQEIVDNEKT